MITFDLPKREWTLLKRGLDFADADIVFAGDTLDFVDDRQDYGEVRMISVGHLHMISMRKANERYALQTPNRKRYGEG